MSLETEPSPAAGDLRFRGRCDHAAGAVDLGRYPNLAHTADRGVFTHLAGVSVGELAAIAADSGTFVQLEELATRAGVTFDELLDALRFARANMKD